MSSLSFGKYTVELSNPDKVLYPDEGITKFDLIEYYRELSDTILPHLRDRPLMMHRFPDGIGAFSFYQKEIGDYFPDWIERIEVSKEDGTTTHVVCNNVATLVYLANQACITPHVWLSRVDRLDDPDQMVFDLDPPGDEFEPVRFAARQLKKLLDELQLPSYVKTTGSSGLHVCVPLDRSGDFDAVRSFARTLAAVLAEREPSRLTVEQRKNKRGGRLYLDTARNAYAQTAVAPYAIRPLAGAPVATPLDWHELQDADLDARTYTLSNIRRRLGQKDDPWRDMRKHGVRIATARKRLDCLLPEEETEGQ